MIFIGCEHVERIFLFPQGNLVLLTITIYTTGLYLLVNFTLSLSEKGMVVSLLGPQLFVVLLIAIIIAQLSSFYVK
jgi:hypothetical protein